MGFRKAYLPALGVFIMGLGTVYYFTIRKDNTDSQRYVNRLTVFNYEKTRQQKHDSSVKDSLLSDRYLSRRFNKTKFKNTLVTSKDPLYKDSLVFERNRFLNSQKLPPVQSLREVDKISSRLESTTLLSVQENESPVRSKTRNSFPRQPEKSLQSLSNNVPLTASKRYRNTNRNGENLIRIVNRNENLSPGINVPSRVSNRIIGDIPQNVNRDRGSNVPSYLSDQFRYVNNMNANQQQNQDVRWNQDYRNRLPVQTNVARQPENQLPVQTDVARQQGNAPQYAVNQNAGGVARQQGNPQYAVNQNVGVARQQENSPRYSVNQNPGLPVGSNVRQQGNLPQQNYNLNNGQNNNNNNNIASQSRTSSGLPSRAELATMDYAGLSAIYHRYVNTKQETCKNMVRLGNVQDGGWDICDDERYRPKSNCTVLSFGINFDFSFDDAIANRYGCQVHCYDPSMKRPDHRRSSKIYFHAQGLSSTDSMYNSWPMKRLSTIRRDLGLSQTPIDVLKIDIEMWELPVIPDMVKSGSMKDIKQFVVEIHLDLTEGRVLPPREKYEKAFDCLRYLYDDGFRIVYTHRNPYCLMKQHKGKDKRWGCHEISFVRP